MKNNKYNSIASIFKFIYPAHHILLLGLSSSIFPAIALPILPDFLQLATLNAKVVAQELPPAKTDVKTSDTQEVTIVKLGVLAKQGEQAAIAQWQPTADYLSNTIPKHKFELVPLGFEEMHAAAKNNELDFFIINSGMYVDFEANYGVNRIATLKNLRLGKPYTEFGGVIITRADRLDINQLRDFKGKTFMAVNPVSFGGWQMAWDVFQDAGIKPKKHFKKLSFGGTHDSVIEAVLNGEVDGGTVRTDALERLAQKGAINLNDFKIINQQQTENFPFVHSTPLYPEWPFASNKENSLELKEKVAKLLLNMPEGSLAAKASKSEGWTVPLNYRPVHDLFIDLAIAPYDDIGQVTVQDLFWYWIAIAASLVASAGFVVYSQRRSLEEQKINEHSLSELNKSLEQSVAEQSKQRQELEDSVVSLMEALEPAADGDLTTRAQLLEGDVGIIADLFNAIIENLREIAVQVKNSASQASLSLKENEGSIRDIAEQAIAEAEQIRNTLFSVEQMSSSIQDVAENAEKTAVISNDAFASAKQGNIVMDDTVQSIQGLRNTIGDTAKKIKRLGESAQQISQVVALIDEIALKTNLLAINASVEAARAGELGQGFTAVAEQVGALAEQSATATKEIAQLISGIQQETQEVVAAMETGTSQVVDSTRLVEETKVSLQDMLTKSQEIDGLMKSISQATISQAKTSQEVTEIMEGVTEKSEQRSQSSIRVAEAIEITAKIVRELQNSVAQFRVNDTDEIEETVMDFQTSFE